MLVRPSHTVPEVDDAWTGFRAAASLDLEDDQADIDRRVSCPTLVFYGSTGQMANLFDVPAAWRKQFSNLTAASLPGGHFFVDQFPAEAARTLRDFLPSAR